MSTVESPAAMDVSIVVPCYRDETGLPQLFESLGPVMDGLGRAELILVEDGSPDRTGIVAEQLAAEFRHPTTVVHLLRNFGQHPAVFAGFEQARGRVVVTMDSDLQYPPEEIPKLLAELSPEHPVVSGYRETRNDPRSRGLITRIVSWWLRRRTKSEMRDFGSMFKAYDRSVVDMLLTFQERRRFVTALVGWLGVPVKEVPVRHEARGEGGSRYELVRLVDMLFDILTGYSTFPLRVVTSLGLGAAILGLAVTVGLALYRILVGAGGAGAISVYALIFLLLTLILLFLAILGEYVGRVYIEVKHRPYFLVRSTSRHDPSG